MSSLSLSPWISRGRLFSCSLSLLLKDKKPGALNSCPLQPPTHGRGQFSSVCSTQALLVHSANVFWAPIVGQAPWGRTSPKRTFLWWWVPLTNPGPPAICTTSIPHCSPGCTQLLPYIIVNLPKMGPCLLYSLLNPWRLAQCLAHSRC